MIISLMMAFCFVAPSQTTVAFLKKAPSLLTTNVHYTEGLKEVPIQVRKDKILVKASLDGEQGFLILDTGAPNMIVNKKVRSGNGEAAFSVSGELCVEPISINQLSWRGVEETHLEALAVDLSHLETALECKILGMIGYEMIKDLAIIIDFTNQKLLIEHKDEENVLRRFAPKYSIPFELASHLPIIEATINKQVVRLGIDTGTGSNLLDSKLTNGVLANHFTFHDIERLQGLDQQIEEVKAGTIDRLTIEGHEMLAPEFLAVDLTQLRLVTGLEIDGLLGYSFFDDYLFSIDFNKKRIYFW
jgi:hypothetical protein